MSRGPLPQKPENRRRRNAPTIPTTKLPVSGRKGTPPKPPADVALGEKGQAWWKWAWHTPQAVAWSRGDLYAIARRARLEDDFASLEEIGFGPLPFDPEDVQTYLEHVEAVVRTLKRMAGGSLALEREMRELDDRLGLTPKALAQLRWEVVADPTKEMLTEDDGESELERKRAEREARLAAEG